MRAIMPFFLLKTVFRGNLFASIGANKGRFGIYLDRLIV